MNTQPDHNSCITYKKGALLGKGGFARCYQLINQQTGEIQAVKIIQKSSLTKPRSKQKLMSQIKIHQSINNQNIVQFRRHFEDNMNTLNDMLKRRRKLLQTQIRQYLLQILNALQYLHSKRTVHRDLKLGNIFLNQSMQIKMGDFGLATKLQYSGQKKRTVCGTPNYIAPQVLAGTGHGIQVDIWSFGVICYTLVYGRPPFQSKDVKQTYKKIKSGVFSFPDTVSLTNSFKQLIINTLQKQPHKRPTATQLKKYQYFTNTSLSRQPSISFRNHSSSISIPKDITMQKQLSRSDNGRMYTNNDIMNSKDTARQKSQDKFLITDRSTTSVRKNLNTSNLSNLRRANSQRVLKQSSNTYHQFSNNGSKTNLTKSPSKKTIISNPSLNLLNQQNYVSIKKWVDYSSKYGIGYSLTNGSCGVYFNDSSKIVSCSDLCFYYIQKIAKQDCCQKYNFNDYPVQLTKKVRLFGHFKGYLYGNAQNNQLSNINQKDLIYIRRWYRAKHAVIFRLNNRSVQVLFIDQSQILINSQKKKVLFTSKTKQKSQYILNQVMLSGNRQLMKRFQYTRQVLNQMTGLNQQKIGSTKKA